MLDRVARRARSLRDLCIRGVDVNVVDVNQQGAAGAPRQTGQEDRLGKGISRQPVHLQRRLCHAPS